MKKILPKLSSLIDTIICLLLVIVTLSKGGFYKEDILFPVLLVNILGVILAVIKVILNIKNNGIISKSKLVTIMDIFIALLPIAYVLPILFKKSFSIENSIFEVLRYTNVAIIYYIVRSSKNTNLYLNVLLGIASVVGIFGVDEITYRVVEKINLPLGYLERNGSVISSVVQYANIAAIIMLIGVTICINKIENNNKKLYKYLLVFLQIQILLTSSRMGVGLLIIQLIIYSVRKNLGLILSFIVALVSSGIISNLVENSNYICTILLYVALIPLIFLYDYIYEKICKFVKGRLNKKTLVYMSIIIISFLALCFILPSNLNISEGNTITRKTTKYVYGENEVYLKIVPESKDTEFIVTIYQIYEDYKPEKVKEIDSSDFKNSEYKGIFKTTEGSKFVEFVYSVKQGEICVENVKINNEEIIMSYLLLPDRLTFRVKDSMSLDLNNTLRVEYYNDALKLIKRTPIVGNGGEGFKLGYQMVQEDTYISSEVHSSPLQIYLESGVIGFISYLVINVLGVILCLKMYKQNKKLTMFIILISINIMALFDLTFSFAIISYIIAVILGVIVNEYMKTEIKDCDRYELDNKSILAMGSIIFLCFCIVAISSMVIYNGKIYKASLITLPEVREDTEEYNDKLFEKMIALENKVELDKYNINYMIELDNTYSEYINILKGLSLSAINEQEKEKVNAEIAKYVLRQKANVDNMIECEYYSKYALQQVANCYFNNYFRYAQILEDNFENKEVAYSFYLGYALKLTSRILEVGPKNAVANQMYKNMLEVYIENLSNQNKYIKSMAITGIIKEMEQKIADYTEL